MTKRIGILTSGGDCAGLNATIRAVALRAHHGYGWTTIGISHGTLGLLRSAGRGRAARSRRGSTRRWRARAAPSSAPPTAAIPFAFPMADGSKKDRSAEMVEGLRELHLDGLIGVGGDGSLEILRRLLATTAPAVHRHPQDHRQRRRQHRARRSAIRRRSPSPPRRSTACSRPAPATSASWCWR